MPVENCKKKPLKGTFLVSFASPQRLSVRVSGTFSIFHGAVVPISAEARNKSAGAQGQSTIHVSKVKVEEVEEVEEVQVEGFVRQISMTSMTSIHLFHQVHKLDTLFISCFFYGLKVFLGDSVRWLHVMNGTVAPEIASPKLRQRLN